MGEFESTIPTYNQDEGEKHMIAAAQHMVKALAAGKNMSSELRQNLLDLHTQLSTTTKLTEETTEIEEGRFLHAQNMVISWQLKQSMIWESGPQQLLIYLQAVDDVRRLAEKSLLPNRNEKEKELFGRAQCILQVAMGRLEEELVYILGQSRISFEPESFSSYSCEENDGSYSESVVSTEYYSCREDGIESEAYITDLIHPDAISEIKSIANVMFAANYDQQFRKAFVSFWKDALEEEYLIILGMDKLSIEDVLKTDRSSSCIMKWCLAMKIVIRSFLPSEKRVFDHVFGSFQSTSSTSFLAAAKAPVLCLLNFGETIAVSSRQPERFFQLIHMYEVLVNLLQDIDTLFPEEITSFPRIEFLKLLRKIGDSVKSTFVEFRNQVASFKLLTTPPDGGVHYLTKYVMSCIKPLAEYGDTLNLFLQEQEKEELDLLVEAERVQDVVTSMHETSLNHISNLYKDGSLRHIFMMNNIHYMVRKVGQSDELGAYFGKEWLVEQTKKVRHHAISCIRATWNPVLTLLKLDYLLLGTAAGKGKLEDRFRGFNTSFEGIYTRQTGWCVQDLQLREDLQISISQMVIPAYRSFFRRFSENVRVKYIKFSADDVGNYIMDLFQGSPRTLHKISRGEA